MLQLTQFWLFLTHLKQSAIPEKAGNDLQPPFFIEMIDNRSLFSSKGSLYRVVIPKDGLFHKTVLLSQL